MVSIVEGSVVVINNSLFLLLLLLLMMAPPLELGKVVISDEGVVRISFSCCRCC
jgi:hypothetical protein